MRQLLSALFLGIFLTASAVGQDLILGISEGTSGGLDRAQVVNKYQTLGDAIGKAIKRRVSVVFVREFAQLEEGMKVQRFDFVMARPSDYPARGLRNYGSQFVASAKPDGQCHIVVPKGSPITTLEQAKGKRWVMPEEVAYMSKFCKAELRDRGIVLKDERVQFVREQAAVGFYLENTFGDVGGVASYSGVAKGWEA
jgi:phosphonate transport system substrate-binding protein